VAKNIGIFSVFITACNNVVDFFYSALKKALFFTTLQTGMSFIMDGTMKH